ncbi:MAG: threonine/serine exporter family protein [Thomasclavelia ramosa]
MVESDETIIAVGIGFILYFFIWLMEILEINNLVSTLLSSMVLTAIAIISLKLGLITNLQSTIIGCLMILTPGVAITNSLRDIMGSDHISGMARMLEALLTATFIAIGVGTMMMVLGG